MTRQELERWLCGPEERLPTPTAIAALLGVPLAQIADTTLLRTAARLRGLCFTIAVLRDVFPDDRDVHDWLRRSRAELGGRAALDLIRAGRMAVVDELAVHEWHRSSTGAVRAGTAEWASA